METLLNRKLIVVTGKGGVGKTTIAGAIGLIASRRGTRTLVVDVTGASAQLRRLFDARPSEEGEPVRLAEGLWSLSIDPEQALLEWMRALAGRVPARLLASKSSFQYFAAAAPGAKELVCMVKVWRLAGGQGDGGRYDLVVLDAPATGHALAMLDSPQTFASIARVGPIAVQAEAVREMLQDREQTGYLAVAQASEMAVTETLELRQELRSRLGVEPAGVIVNATLRRRFTGDELTRIAALRGGESAQRRVRVAHAAAEAAHAAHARTRFQHSQVARLRRHGLTVLRVPFLFAASFDLDALELIVEELKDAL